MRVSRPHGTSAEVARDRLEGRIGDLLARFGGAHPRIERSWAWGAMSFRLDVRGVSVGGTLTVDATDVTIEIAGTSSWDRLRIKPFEAKVRSEVEEGLRETFPD